LCSIFYYSFLEVSRHRVPVRLFSCSTGWLQRSHKGSPHKSICWSPPRCNTRSLRRLYRSSSRSRLHCHHHYLHSIDQPLHSYMSLPRSHCCLYRCLCSIHRLQHLCMHRRQMCLTRFHHYMIDYHRSGSIRGYSQRHS